MKVRKPHRIRYEKQLDNQETLQNFLRVKQYQQKVQKEQFFRQIFNQIQSSFDEKNLQIFQEYVQNIILQSKMKKNKQTHNKSKNHTQNLCQGKPLKKVQINTDNNLRIYRKLDEHLFEQKIPGIFPKSMTYRAQNKQRFISTPKFKRPNNLLVVNQIYQMQNKMRKHYQRIKQRVLGQNIDKQEYKPYVFVRNSLSQMANKLQQRKIRYKTQSMQTDISELHHIPTILLSDIATTKKRVIHRRILDLQDRRLQCFQNSQKNSKRLI